MDKKKLVILTGAGISKETGIPIIDKETLNEIVSFETSGLDNNQIISTQSGIITFNNVKCQILNTK